MESVQEDYIGFIGCATNLAGKKSCLPRCPLETGAELHRLSTRSGSNFAMVKTPVWSELGPGMVSAMQRAAQILRDAGASVEDVELPVDFDGTRCYPWRLAWSFTGSSVSLSRDQTGDELARMAENIKTFPGQACLQAFDTVAALRPKMHETVRMYSVHSFGHPQRC